MAGVRDPYCLHPWHFRRDTPPDLISLTSYPENSLTTSQSESVMSL